MIASLKTAGFFFQAITVREPIYHSTLNRLKSDRKYQLPWLSVSGLCLDSGPWRLSDSLMTFGTSAIYDFSKSEKYKISPDDSMLG